MVIILINTGTIFFSANPHFELLKLAAHKRSWILQAIKRFGDYYYRMFADILRMFQPSLKLTYFFIPSCPTLLPFFLMNDGALIYRERSEGKI
jgi:hypothetical protein